MDQNNLPAAPEFEATAAKIVALTDLQRKGPVVLAFFDSRGSDFWTRRLVALEAELSRFRDRNVQVLGITADDDPISLGQWARTIGVTFDLLADVDGRISRKFGLYSDVEKATDRALVVVNRGRILLRDKVEGTEIPDALFAALAIAI